MCSDILEFGNPLYSDDEAYTLEPTKDATAEPTTAEPTAAEATAMEATAMEGTIKEATTEI